VLADQVGHSRAMQQARDRALRHLCAFVCERAPPLVPFDDRQAAALVGPALNVSLPITGAASLPLTAGLRCGVYSYPLSFEGEGCHLAAEFFLMELDDLPVDEQAAAACEASAGRLLKLAATLDADGSALTGLARRDGSRVAFVLRAPFKLLLFEGRFTADKQLVRGSWSIMLGRDEYSQGAVRQGSFNCKLQPFSPTARKAKCLKGLPSPMPTVQALSKQVLRSALLSARVKQEPALERLPVVRKQSRLLLDSLECDELTQIAEVLSIFPDLAKLRVASAAPLGDCPTADIAGALAAAAFRQWPPQLQYSLRELYVHSIYVPSRSRDVKNSTKRRIIALQALVSMLAAAGLSQLRTLYLRGYETVLLTCVAQVSSKRCTTCRCLTSPPSRCCLSCTRCSTSAGLPQSSRTSAWRSTSLRPPAYQRHRVLRAWASSITPC